MKGWICLHRKFLKWEWAGDPNMVAMFIYLLLMANTDDGYKWKGISLDRGQLLTGRKKLAKETGLSEQTVRTCLKRLESTNEITIKPTNHYSIITICNYSIYQDKPIKGNQQINQQDSQRLTINQPSTNHIQQDNNITSDKDNNDVMNDLELMFENFRKAYKGNKRGFKLEFENLKKKRPKDWKDIVPKLMPALDRLMEWREEMQKAGKFVPDWAMLATWINQSRWETEFETINNTVNGSGKIGNDSAQSGAGTPNYDEEF